MAMKVSVIIPAAGAASRYAASGGQRHKLEEDIAGRAVLYRTIEIFSSRDDVASIVVAGPWEENELAEFRERHGAKLGFYGCRLCRGGREHRWESVLAALGEVGEGITHVAIHDAARPCASQRLVDRVFEAAERFDAVVPGVAVGDTVKRVAPMDGALADDPLDAILGGGGKLNTGFSEVVGTVERAGLVLVQTPQVFERGLIERAYAQGDLSSTDDAGLVERLGERVVVVEGEARNIKITHAADLAIARAIFGPGKGSDRESHKRF